MAKVKGYHSSGCVSSHKTTSWPWSEGLSLSLPPSLALSLALEKQVAMMWTVYGEGHMAGNYRLCLKTEGLSLTTARSWICQISMWAWKRSRAPDESTAQPHLDCSPVKLWAEDPAKPGLDFGPKETEVVNVHVILSLCICDDLLCSNRKVIQSTTGI